MVVSLLANAIGNARYAELVILSGSPSAAQVNTAGGSQHGFSRGRISSNSSVGSNTGSRSTQRRPSRLMDTSSEISAPVTASAGHSSYHPPTFAHLDGADLSHVDNGGAWGLFAEMIRMTPFGGSLWTAVTDTRAAEIAEKDVRFGLGINPASGESDSDQNIILSDLAADDIIAEKARLDDYLQNVSNLSPFHRVKINISNAHDTISSSSVVIEAGKRFLLIAAQLAITAIEATNVLVLLSLWVINGHENKALLMSEEVIAAMMQMLFRVDEGLDLLGSCREQSRAMAMGSAEQDRPSVSKKPTTSNEGTSDSSSQVHARITSLLVKLTFDNVSFSPREDETLLLGDVAVYWSVLKWTQLLLSSGRSRLQAVALKYLLGVQRLCPIISVAIEKCGLQNQLLGLVADTAKAVPENNHDIISLPWANFSSALLILQRQAVALHVESQDVCAALTMIILQRWFPSLNDSEAQRAYRCFNCESEVAQYECLGESCIRENCHLLCVECDKVFHKSSSKRAHIRLNTFRCHFIGDRSTFTAANDSDNALSKIVPLLEACLSQPVRGICDSVAYIRSPPAACFLVRELVTSCLCTTLGGILLESTNWETRFDLMPYFLSILLLVRRLAVYPLNNIAVSADIDSALASALDDCRVVLQGPQVSGATPPSKWQRSPRRLLHNSTMRFLASVMFFHSSHHRSGDLAECLRLDGAFHGLRSVIQLGLFLDQVRFHEALHFIFVWQLEAVLIHNMVSDPSQTHLGHSERQAVMWMLRELYQAGSRFGDLQPLTKSVSCWIMWCMRATLPVSCAAFKMTANSYLPTQVLLPIGAPVMNKQILLILMQELCILFGGFDHCVSGRFDLLCLESDSHYSRENSRDSNALHNSSFALNFLPLDTPRSVLTNNDSAKRSGVTFTLNRIRDNLSADFLSRADFIALLLVVGFGDLVDLVGRLPVAALEKALLKFARGVVTASEHEQEVFCLSIQLLGEIIVLHHESRSIVDTILGYRTFVTMMQGLCEAFDAVSSSERVTSTLAKLALHQCLSGSLCFHPLIGFDRMVFGISRGTSDSLFYQRFNSLKLYEQQQPQRALTVVQRVPIQLSPQEFAAHGIDDSPSNLLNLPYYNLGEVCVLSNVLRGAVAVQVGSDTAVLADLQSYYAAFDFVPLMNSEKRIETLGLRNNRPTSRPHIADDQVEDLEVIRNVPRRTSRRMLTSMSIASFDAADAVARWEVESLGRSSAAYGELVSRGSLGSNQSVIAIMQALKAMPMEAVLQLPDCDDRHLVSGHPELPSPQPALTRENLVSRQQSSNQSVLDTAQETLDRVSDLLVGLSRYMQSVAPIMVVLHQSLVQRAGLSSWLEDLEHESASDAQQNVIFPIGAAEERYYNLLKRHLGAFFLTKSEHLLSLRGDYPDWNHLMFRDQEGMENLLALTLLFGERLHAPSSRVLAQMLQRNPRCLHALASSSSALLVLHRLAASLPRLSDNALRLFQQSLAYSTDEVLLQYLLDCAQSGSPQESLQAFHVMNSVLEIRPPRAFLQFSCLPATVSRSLKLTSIQQPSSAMKGFCVSMWLKLNWLEHGCVGNIFHCKLGGSLFYQVFVRSLYETSSSSSSSPQKRRRYQLCIRLGQSAVDVSSWKSYAQAGENSAPSSPLPKSRQVTPLPPQHPHLSNADSQEGQILGLAADALAGMFLPDLLSSTDSLQETSWTLLQIQFKSGVFSVVVNDRKVPLQRFTPQGYSLSAEVTDAEKEFLVSMEKQLEKHQPIIVLGGDYFSEKLCTFLPTTFDGMDADAAILKMDAVVSSEVLELVRSVKQTSRCMGMQIAEVLVSDVAPSRELQLYWLFIGPYGGLMTSLQHQTSVLQVWAQLVQQDVAIFAGSATQQNTNRSANVYNLGLDPSEGVQSSFTALNHHGASSGRSSLSTKAIQSQLVQQELSISKGVAVHSGQHFLFALRKLEGFKALFPLLLSNDTTKITATLTLLLNCIHGETEYETFLHEKLDAALVYIFTMLAPNDAADAIPLLCDWVRFSPDESTSQNLPRGDSGTHQYFVRPEVISWTGEVICSLIGNLQAALRWTQWAKDQVLDVPSRSMLLAKQITSFTLFSLGCLWVFDDWSIEQQILPAVEETRKSLFPKSPIAGNSISNTHQYGIPIQYSTTSFDQLETACNAYLVQTQAFRLLRLMLLQQTLSLAGASGTAASASTLATSSLSAASIGARSLVQTLQQLLMTAIFCARRAASESLSATRDRRTEKDNIRKLERLKAKLRATASTASLLKQGDCFTSAYWHASAAVHLLRLVQDVLLRDTTLIRGVGNVLLSQVSVELLASSVPELRARAITLALLSAATPEGTVDAKRIADMEKTHFFDLLSEQLTAPRDPYDETVLEALQSFLFWRLRMDQDTKYAYFVTVQQQTAHLQHATHSAVEEVVVPQCLGAFFRLLHHARHCDLLRGQLSCLLDFSLGGRGAHLLHPVSEGNLDKLLSRKDWIWELADLISAHQRKWQESSTVGGDDDQTGIFSLSESESVAGMSVGSSSHYLSGAESDDTNSIATTDDGLLNHSVNISPESGKITSIFDHEALRADFIARFTEPIKQFLVFVVSCELLKRPGAGRRWNELFRLALPETSRLLEEILMMVLHEIEHVSVVQQESETGISFLLNVGSFLEQLLEKAQVSLSLCVHAVQTLQTLNYRCCQELRLKAAKDVQLREARNALLLRCLAETGQELPLRVSAVLELTNALQAYALQTEYKVMTDSSVCILLLGMWLEVLDDLQSNALHQQQLQHLQQRDAADSEWLRASLDCLAKLAGLVKSVMATSAEAQRSLGRLWDSLASDEEKLCANYFSPSKAPSSAYIASAGAVMGSSTKEVSNALATINTQSNVNQYSSATTAMLNSNTTAAASSAGGGSVVNSSSTSSWWLGWSLGSTSSASASSVPTTITAASHAVGNIADSSENGVNGTSDPSESPISGDLPAEVSASATEYTGTPVSSTGKVQLTLKPTDARSFVIWFCRSERSEVQMEVRQKVGKELRGALRAAEKLREKTSQRLLRHVKSLQDKRSRERLQQAKMVADGLQSTRTLLDKNQSQFFRELQAWQRNLRERLQQGRDACRWFTDGSTTLLQHQQLNQTRSPRASAYYNGNPNSSLSMDASGNLPPTNSGLNLLAEPTTSMSSSVGNNSHLNIGDIVFSDEQRRLAAMHSFRLPAALVDFLLLDPQLQPSVQSHTPQISPSHGGGASGSSSEQASNVHGMIGSDSGGKLRPTEALHALLECFASAKRIVLLLE
jgi:hypothetical protein